MSDMENLTVPIGLTPKIKKGETPDLKGIVVQELQYAFMARHYNLFEEEKQLVWPDDCEYHPYIEDLNWLIETRIKEFRDWIIKPDTIRKLKKSTNKYTDLERFVDGIVLGLQQASKDLKQLRERKK